MSTGLNGALTAPAEPRRRSRRLLARLSDERLVALFRRGNEFAFEELFDRHSRGVLSFCTRILCSREEGEDAHQHTFLAAYQAIRGNEFEPRDFKPWLYTIARNHCFSVLRSRRQTESPDDQTIAAGEQTDEQAEQHAEVRELLTDVRGLPEPQRVALLLSELGDLSHTEIAQVIACPRQKVKSLLFQARTSLCLSREARETPCSRVREELAGSLGSRLPVALRRHVQRCEGCSEFASEIRRRRRLIAIALPVAPSIGLKRSALAAVGAAGAGSGGRLMAGLSAKGVPMSGTGGASAVGGPMSGASAGAGAVGGPLSAILAAKAGLVIAATAGVAAVGVVGTGVMQAPWGDEPSRDRSPASEGRSGTTESRAPLTEILLPQRDGVALAADRRQDPPRSSAAPPGPARLFSAARPRPSLGERAARAAPRARGAPVPDLGVRRPAPDLDVAAPLLDPLTGLPLLDLAGLLGTRPPELGVARPPPDVGLPKPVPDVGVGEPPPDLGSGKP